MVRARINEGGDDFDDGYGVIGGVGTTTTTTRERPLLELLGLTSTGNSRVSILKVLDLTKGI